MNFTKLLNLIARVLVFPSGWNKRILSLNLLSIINFTLLSKSLTIANGVTLLSLILKTPNKSSSVAKLKGNNLNFCANVSFAITIFLYNV